MLTFNLSWYQHKWENTSRRQEMANWLIRVHYTSKFIQKLRLNKFDWSILGNISRRASPGATGWNLKAAYTWICFDGIISTSPPDCKINECNFMALGHLPKIRQIQTGGFFVGVSIWKNFDIIKYSRIIYCWLAKFMPINFYKRTNTLKWIVFEIWEDS